MDPLTIACTVGAITKAVTTVSMKLYVFFDDANQIDENVKALSAELTGLTSSLKAIQTGLKLPTLKDSSDASGKSQTSQLWQALDGNLTSCETTVDQLGAALDNLRPSNSSFISRVGRQVKMDMKKDQIAAWRQRIQTHSNALSLALQMINLQAIWMAPGQVTADLGPRIELVRSMVEGLSPSSSSAAFKDQVLNGSSTSDPKNSPGDQANTLEQIEKLKATARTIISSASSVAAGQSEVGGSVFGEPMDPAARKQTMTWLKNAPSSEHRNPPRIQTASPAPLSATRSSASADITPSPNVPDQPPTRQNSFNVEDSDGDDSEVDVDVVETSMIMGRDYFNRGDYSKAKTFLLKGVTDANKLPPHHRNDSDLQSSELRLAACYYHLNDLNGAKTQLIILADNLARIDKDAPYSPRLYQAYHLLAQVHFLQRQYDEALTQCKKAIKGRKKMRSQNTTAMFESYALISNIYTALDDEVTAEVYLNMIQPESARTALLERARSIPTTPAPPDLARPGINSQPTQSGLQMEELSPSDPGRPPPEYSYARTMSVSSPSVAGSEATSFAAVRPGSRQTGSPNQNKQLASPWGATPAIPIPQRPKPSVSEHASVISGGSSPSGHTITAAPPMPAAPPPLPTADLTRLSAVDMPKKKSSWFKKSSGISRKDTSSSVSVTEISLGGTTSNFCPGAMAIRENRERKGIKSGMSSRMEPLGVTTSMVSFWRCKHCIFQSDMFQRELKPAQMEQITLPGPYGMQYKWIFLAKSHLKLSRAAMAAVAGPAMPHFACIFCASADPLPEREQDHGYRNGSISGSTVVGLGSPNALDSFAGAQALMAHIYEAHSANMSPADQLRYACIIGPTTSTNWDILIPESLRA